MSFKMEAFTTAEYWAAVIKIKKKCTETNFSNLFLDKISSGQQLKISPVWFGFFNGISTFVGYLMPKPSS